MTLTDVLAIIGAITGTTGMIAGLTALGWDYYKWRYAERVQLKVTAIPGYVTDRDPLKKLIMVSVTNVGKIPTTIKLLSLHGFNTKAEQKKPRGKKVSIVLNPLYAQLPIKLNSGDDWVGYLLQNEENLGRYDEFEHFIIQIEDTMSKKPFRAEVDRTLIKD
jgi:hypothetical protein